MRRVALLACVAACGTQSSRAPASTPRRTGAAEMAAQDDVDRDPGHDEPLDEDESATDSQRTRRPRETQVARGTPVLQTLEGRASYYSDRLAGRSTASGEPYRLREFTAASRDLPFGTLVRVVRLSRAGDEELGSVVVRVNDRGPFGDHRRILDLSRAAAEALDMIGAGVVPVRAEILRNGP